MAHPSADLFARLPFAMAADAVRLERRIDRARARHAQPAEWLKIKEDLARSIAKREGRAAAKPAFTYPPELPVAQRATDIERAIRDHPVVIVCGETGSGKTTQLPKICLAAGRGERGSSDIRSPGGSRRARSPPVSRMNSASPSARRSGTRCASPTTRGPTRT